MDGARHRALVAGGGALAVAGAALVGWWLITALTGASQLTGSSHVPTDALLGLLLVALGAAAALGGRLAAELAAALASLACAAFLLFISTNAMRGLTPPPGQPLPGPEPVTLVAGLAFVSMALALVLGVPRRGR